AEHAPDQPKIDPERTPDQMPPPFPYISKRRFRQAAARFRRKPYRPPDTYLYVWRARIFTEGCHPYVEKRWYADRPDPSCQLRNIERPDGAFYDLEAEQFPALRGQKLLARIVTPGGRRNTEARADLTGAADLTSALDKVADEIYGLYHDFGDPVPQI